MAVEDLNKNGYFFLDLCGDLSGDLLDDLRLLRLLLDGDLECTRCLDLCR